MIIDENIKNLVLTIESATVANPELLNAQITSLIQLLEANCLLPEVQQRYVDYFSNKDIRDKPATEYIGSYPIDDAGYAMAFDPLTEEQQLWDNWQKFGVVVSKQVITTQLAQKAIMRIGAIAEQLSDGWFEIDKPETHQNLPKDSNGTPFISRGFAEIYHDDFLAQIRQSLRVYLHYVIIWGRVDLWTTFDRVGVKLAGHPESKGLPLHVDQNPILNPYFKQVQGVLALSDCPAERGTFVAVPGSRALFPQYGQIVMQQDPGYTGEYVQLDFEQSFASDLVRGYQILPLRSGCLASWDSRNTHANSPNLSGEARKVAYISTVVAKEYSQAFNLAREEAFTSGQAKFNHDAGLHVTQKPRFTEPSLRQATRQTEKLSPLGALLYGQQSYNKILRARSKKRLLLNAEAFGFGPTAAIADFFPELRRMFEHVAFIGSGHTLELQRGLGYDQIYNLDAMANDGIAIETVLTEYDVFFTALDFKVATIAANLGLPTIIYDCLAWYWPTIPEILQHRNVLYLAQNFHGVAQRIAEHASSYSQPHIVAPILKPIRKEFTNVERDTILINFGGLNNPYWDNSVSIAFAKVLCQAIRDLLPIDAKLVVIGNTSIASAVNGTNFSREQMMELLPKVKLAFITPGLGNINECAQYNIPTVYLPPANDSQALQAELMFTHNCCDARVDWADIDFPINYHSDQKEIMAAIADVVERLVGSMYLQNTLCAKLFIAHDYICGNTETKAHSLIQQFGINGVAQVVAATQSFANAHRPEIYFKNKLGL